MRYQTLGRSGLRVSAISFGAGPVAGLMVGPSRPAQRLVVQRALQHGINWFDTAAMYGAGTSETNLGEALRSCDGYDYHIATKVRVLPEQLTDIRGAVRESFTQSLDRLGLSRVTLIQLHNSVTRERGDLPTSLCVDDVLGPHGVLAEFQRLRDEKRVDHFGFTGLGDYQSLRRLMECKQFASAQIPWNLLAELSGADRSAGSIDVDYAQLMEDCVGAGIAVVAIRVLAGGALAQQVPSAHTQTTRFFPLDLYERDQERAASLAAQLPVGLSLAEASIRAALHQTSISTALIGFANCEQIDEVVQWLDRGPLDSAVGSPLVARRSPS